MIELELKYELDKIPDPIKNIKVIKEKRQEDIYYDTPEYDLLRNGNFLRIRDGKRLEFKLFAGDTSHLFCQETDFNLDEIESNKEKINSLIASINLKTVKELASFEQLLEINHLKVLSPIVKHRISYEFNEYSTISVDNVDNLGLFLEAEIMIDNNSLSNAKGDLMKKTFVKDLQSAKILTGNEKPVNIGYVELYLLKYNIEAYNLGIYKL